MVAAQMEEVTATGQVMAAEIAADLAAIDEDLATEASEEGVEEVKEVAEE